MYRLFASDVDDTLLAIDGTLPEDTRRALRLLHDSGVTVVLSSGRATTSMMPIVHRVIEPADDEYVISFNGGRVVTALSEHVIFEEVIPSDLIAELMVYARENRLHVHGYGSDNFLVEEGGGTRSEESERYSLAAGLPYEVVPRLETALPSGSVKLLIIGEHGELVEHQKGLRRIAGNRLSVMFSKPHYLEVVASGVSKGHALSMLAGKLGLGLDQCVAMGDSLNDIEMIRTAGLGVAVANARDEVKTAADLVLNRSADEAAVVELLERSFPEVFAKW